MTETDQLARVRGVVLDLDGTLVDTIADVAAALSGAFEAAGLPGVGPEQVLPAMGHGSVDLVRSVLGGVRDGRDEGADGDGDGAGAGDGDAGGGDGDDLLVQAVHADYQARYAARPAALSTIFADGAEALAALRSAGLRVGICTNKSTRLAHAVLEAVGLDATVEVVVGRDAVPHPKPDPRHLLAVLDQLGLAPEEAVYVGDNPVDVVVGQGAGVEYRHVAWGEPVDASVVRLERFGELVPAPHPVGDHAGAARTKEN